MSIGHLATQTAANARHQHQALIASTRKGGVRLDENRADEIVAAACSGDGAAFAQLWVALSPRVLAYFRSHGTDDAEDLTSEVFLAAFARIDSFSGDADAFRALVFTIAHRRYVDSVRRRRAHGPMLGLDPELDPRRARSAEADAVGMRAAVDLLASLTEDQRQVVTLRVIADLSVRDTARALGKDEGAVKALQRHALARLRQKVGPPRFLSGGWRDWKDVMPDVHGADLFGELDRNDPLRVELVRLRSLAECAPPAPSRDLAAFLADPHAARAAAPYHLGSLEQKRSTIMKVIHIRLGKARRAALAAGAAMGLAAVGASAVAAIGETGGPWHTHTVVSDATTTTSTESPTTTSTEAPTGTETTTSTETDTSTSTTSTTATESPTTDEPGGGATHAPNARAFASHHDGVGADDIRADVRGGGSVDHHSGSKPGDDGSGDDAGGSQRGGQSNH